MAPIKDTTRADLLRILKHADARTARTVRIFWGNTPVARLQLADGRWRLDELKVDERAVREGFEEAQREGRGFRPENTWAYYGPGRVILTARRVGALRAAVRVMPWPPRPGPLNGLAWGLCAILG